MRVAHIENWNRTLKIMIIIILEIYWRFVIFVLAVGGLDVSVRPRAGLWSRFCGNEDVFLMCVCVGW